MRIIFVIGPSYSGKSFYIAREHPEAAVVNIFTFSQHVFQAQSNEEIDEIARNAQYYCLEELQNRIRKAGEDDVIILEHQLLFRQAREFYIKGVREVTDTPIECVVVIPDEDLLSYLLENQDQLRNYYNYERSKFEDPTVEEGFVSVINAHPLPKDLLL